MSDSESPGPAAAPDAPYRVLALKYRPQTFDELIGQDAMVRTLSNAIAESRIANAFVLTGVRGVGKTTTARIIARALNCVGPDGTGGPTIRPCGICDNCVAIAESRHIDVLEMDAASRTGVDDIRELLDGSRYMPSSARFKIYIIDEVHMLSRNAFNALLKTLEEPPPHVKFLFATTEIRKVPVTVLSRCQRFDLRRVPEDVLLAHFRGIVGREGAAADDDALRMIARAADGSVRDGLSLLDQAIAHAGGRVDAGLVRDMLGLADRIQVFDLYEHVMAGRIAVALELLRRQYELGADPVVVLQDMLELTHWLTRLKLVPEAADAAAVPEAERVRGRQMVDALGVALLSRVWQMLLKGLGEARDAPAPLAAAEMVLVRLAYAQDLPSPADLVRQLSGPPAEAAAATPPPGGSGGGPAPRAMRAVGAGDAATAVAARPVADAAAAPVPASYAELVRLVELRNELMLAYQLKSQMRLVGYEPGRLVLKPLDNAAPNSAGRLQQLLNQWTGRTWAVELDAFAAGEPTLEEAARQARSDLVGTVRQHPLVQAALARFPGATLTVRPLDEAEPPPAAAEIGEEPLPSDYASDDADALPDLDDEEGSW